MVDSREREREIDSLNEVFTLYTLLALFSAYVLLYPQKIDTSDSPTCDHPYALAHIANHPPKGGKPNVAPFPFDFPLSWPEELRSYIPNRYYKSVCIVYFNSVVIYMLDITVVILLFLYPSSSYSSLVYCMVAIV